MACSHLLSWAPPKSSCVFLVVLKGGSGVGGPRVPWTNMTDLNVELGVLYPFHLLSCPRTLEWAIPTGHSSLCSVTWLLQLVIAVGTLQPWRCQTVVFMFECVCEGGACFFSFFLNHIVDIVNTVPRVPWILYENRHLLVHPFNFSSFKI